MGRSWMPGQVYPAQAAPLRQKRRIVEMQITLVLGVQILLSLDVDRSEGVWRAGWVLISCSSQETSMMNHVLLLLRA